MDSRVSKLHWADYVVFISFLALSTAIGIFYGYKSKRSARTETARSFLTGGNQMHYFPVALSMMASFLSAIFVLSIPAEMYTYGHTYVYLALAYFTGFGIAAHVHLPIYYRLGVTSGYEYLERRFNKTVRVAGALTFSAMILLYLSVVLYTPALALSQVTGLPMTAAILSVGAVCTFYTSLGGMKATIWNDAIQMIIVYICFTLLLAIGTAKVGNINLVFQIAREGGRLTPNFDPNPFIRATFWTHTIGGTFVNLTLYASSQTIIQKFLSTKSVREGQKAVWLSGLTTALGLVMVLLLAMVMYAYYRYCDPVAEGRAAKSDQLVPVFVMDVAGHLHGIPGLFLATAFSAAVSSISGSVNALSAVFLEDLIHPAYKKLKNKAFSLRTGLILSRALALFFGLLTIGISFLAEFFGATVIQIAISVFGMVGSPLMAILTLGMFIPWITSWGALAGLVTSLGVTCWVGFGRIIEQVPNIPLPVSTERCNVTTTPTMTPPPGRTWLKIYDLSFMYYSVLALLVAVVVAIPISMITGMNKGRKLDPRLFFLMSDHFGCCCTPTCRVACRCGVPDVDDSAEAVGVDHEKHPDAYLRGSITMVDHSKTEGYGTYHLDMTNRSKTHPEPRSNMGSYSNPAFLDQETGAATTSISHKF